MGWDKLSGGKGGVGKRLGGGSLPKVTPCSLDLGVPLQRLALHRDQST